MIVQEKKRSVSCASGNSRKPAISASPANAARRAQLTVSGRAVTGSVAGAPQRPRDHDVEDFALERGQPAIAVPVNAQAAVPPNAFASSPRKVTDTLTPAGVV